MIFNVFVRTNILGPPCLVQQGGYVLSDLEHIALPSRFGLGSAFHFQGGIGG